jgi:flagellar biosynthetic protein FliP
MMQPGRLLFFALAMLLLAEPALARDIPLVSVASSRGGTETYSVSIQILLFMTALSFLPAALIMMTSFTRIIIVLAILRQALGTAQTPTNQILVGLALFLTFFIMAPVFDQVNERALQPYLGNKLAAEKALEQAAAPVKGFMLAQTRDTDLALFADIANKQVDKPENAPFTLVLPAFVTSELKTAFQMGFLLFIPFVIIDLAVASVLMSMGMMMLSPMIVSLPFKLMLFVLVDGWALIMGTLAGSFQV